MRPRFRQQREDGNVAARPQAGLAEPPIERRRVHRVGEDDRRRPRRRGEQRVGGFDAAALARRTANVPPLVYGEAARLHGAAVARLDEINVIGADFGKRQADPSMAERREMGDRAFDRRLEIGVDPGMARGGFRPAEGDERPAQFDQIFDSRIGDQRVGDDQRVGEAAFGDPTQRREATILFAFEKDRQVEAVFAEAALEPIEHREEHGVDQRVVGTTRHDHRDEVGLAAPQAPPGLIGRIAELRRRLAHALARQRIDVGAVV